MKRILSILLSVMIVFSLVPSVMAEQSPLAVKYDISCRGTNDIVVPGGSRITVAFTIKNVNDAAFSLSGLENEILYDHNFFEYLPGSEKATICGAKDLTYSEGHHCVYVNTVNKADFAAQQLVVTFDLLVKETQQGESSVIKSVYFNATDGDGNKLANANITPVDLKVTIGETISVYELKYVVDDKTDILNVAKDTPINLRNAPEKEGYIFEGWKINDGEVKNAGAEFTVTGDTEVKAVWKAKNSYKLTFETNGGNSVTQITGYENDVIALNQITSKSGYTFDGWYSDSSLKTKVTSITLTADTTVYAKWSKESTGGGGSSGGGGGGGTKTIDKTRKYTKDIFGNEHPTHIGYINGYPDGSVQPDGDITREEITAILYRITNHQYEKPFAATGDAFPDVEASRWSAHDIEYMADRKIVYGYPDGEFKPARNLSRAEFAALIFRFAGIEEADIENPFTDLADSHWAYKEILALADSGLVEGYEDSTFKPEDNISRAEVMTVVNKLLGRKPLESYVKSLEFNPYNDLFDDKWYYVTVLEATITHNYWLNDTGYEYKWEDWK